MSAARLGVIIVNYRTPELVERCLGDLAPMLTSAQARAVIVDNGSDDGSADRLRAYCEARPEAVLLEVVEAGVNGGFSAGNNVGIDALQSEWVLLLNSDATPEKGALEELMKAAAATPEAGIITPRLVTGEGGEQVSRFRKHSILSEFVEGAQTGPVTRLLPAAEVPIFPQDWRTSPDWVSFAAVLLRREAIDKAGPMDEGFFLYYEDCDYCRRITAHGYTIVSSPNATFRHDPGGTTKLSVRERALERLPAYYYASRSRYFRKYYGFAGPFLANCAWLAGRAIAKLRGLAGRPAPSVCAERARDIWIGWRDALDAPFRP